MHTEETDTRDECVGDESEYVPVSDVADSDSDGGFMSSAALPLLALLGLGVRPAERGEALVRGEDPGWTAVLRGESAAFPVRGEAPCEPRSCSLTALFS